MKHLKIEEVLVAAIVADLHLSTNNKRRMKELLRTQGLDPKAAGLPILAKMPGGSYKLISNMPSFKLAVGLEQSNLTALTCEVEEDDHLYWQLLLNEPPDEVNVFVRVLKRALEYFKTGGGKKFRDASETEETLREFVGDVLGTNRTDIGYFLTLDKDGRQDLLEEVQAGMSIKKAIDIHTRKGTVRKGSAGGKRRETTKTLSSVDELGPEVTEFLRNGLGQNISQALSTESLGDAISVEEEVFDKDTRHLRIVLYTPSFEVTLDLMTKPDNGDEGYVMPIIPINPNQGLDDEGYQIPLAA